MAGNGRGGAHVSHVRPECGKQISDKAGACPNCGCPIESLSPNGQVKIAIPRTEVISGGGAAGLLIAKDVKISSKSGQIWSGKHGDTAIFEIEEPTEITIDLGKWANPVKGTVNARRRYQLIQDFGIHWKATFRLTETDIIDSTSTATGAYLQFRDRVRRRCSDGDLGDFRSFSLLSHNAFVSQYIIHKEEHMGGVVNRISDSKFVKLFIASLSCVILLLGLSGCSEQQEEGPSLSRCRISFRPGERPERSLGLER